MDRSHRQASFPRTAGPTAWLGCALAALVVTHADAAQAELLARTSLGTLIAFPAGEPAPMGNLAVAVGYNFELEPVIVVVEGTGSFALGDETYAGRALAGIRAGFAGPVEPALVLRAGYGNLGISSRWLHGFAFQSGFALDYRLSRSLLLGGELHYDLLTSSESSRTAIHGVGARMSFALSF